MLIEDDPARGLGRALAWASRQDGFDALHVLVARDAGVLARRAALFAVAPTVWSVDGRTLVPADAEPPAAPPAVDDRALALAPVLEEAGATVVVEHGVVSGEVLGLEVARVVVGADGARVEVGVGRHDREAFAMLHGDLPAGAAVRRVVATVRRQRRAGCEHPLRRLAAERWLRDLVVAEPARASASRLEPVPGTVARAGVKDQAPAFAAGADERGGPVVVACSVGIDLDLVPAAADARLAHEPAARLVLVLPERDAHPVTRALAAALARPADVVTVPDGWRDDRAGGLSVP